MVRLKSLGLGLLVVCMLAASLQAQQKCYGRNCGNGLLSRGQYTEVVSSPVQQGIVYHNNHVILPDRTVSVQNSGCGCACSQSNVTVQQNNWIRPDTTTQIYATGGGDYGIAYSKSMQQAAEGRMRHVGGSLGSGGYEGVGFSTRSAEDALRRCCYYGQREMVTHSVVRGANGWYATALFR